MPFRPSHNLRIVQRLWLGLALVFGVCAAENLSAQSLIVHLHDGDRVSGELVSENDKELILSTAFAGRVAVQKSRIARREVRPGVGPPATPQIKPASAQTNAAAPAKASSAAPSPVAKPGGEPAKAQAPEVSRFRKFLSEWHGELELGLNVAYSTTDRQTYSGRFKATHAHAMQNERTLRNTLDYLFSYGRTDGALVDNRMDGSWKTEYEIGKHFLIYNAAGAGYDEIRKIELHYDVGPGVGYKLITKTNFVLKAEVGGNYQQQFLADDVEKRRYSLRLAEDSWWQVTSRLRVDEKIEFFPEVMDLSDFRIRLEGNASYRLLDNLVLKLTVIDLYETSPARNVSNNDLQIRSSIGVKF